jgi:Cd2+/Zn2+-exporting ATPase
MGALGSDAAREAADVVLTDDNPGKIAKAIRGARRTMRIARENVAFALLVKLLVLLLSAFGITGMWMAVFADVGVALLCVLNALRTMKIR